MRGWKEELTWPLPNTNSKMTRLKDKVSLPSRKQGCSFRTGQKTGE